MFCKKERITETVNVYDPLDIYEKFKEQAASMTDDGTFTIDEENIEVIKMLTLYMSNHPDFELLEKGTHLRSKPRLRAGILLIGNPGSGKSLMMRVFSAMKIPGSRINVINCDQITESYERQGNYALDKFNSSYHGNSRIAPYCFDDLGWEKKVAGHFGNKSNCMMEVIMKQERLYQECKHKSHYTSNYSLNELAAMYDIRTESRLSEMCNVIVLGHKADSIDRRKKYQ